MYWREHEPPHFHAKYGDDEIVVEIETGKITGKMSKRAIFLIQDWRKIHINELMNDWELSKMRKQLNKIEPLE